jgi:glycosyltransferase involved in cell wall biosynthesis
MENISIVLCTFNGDRFLETQMNSLREQEGVSEIVVVDDGSTDDTVSIIRRHALEDRRICFFRNLTPLGVAGNFERAISLATGAWIALSDQDDVWLPGKLSRLRGAWNGTSCLLHHATHKFRGSVPESLPFPACERRKFSGSDLRRLLYRNTVVGHTTLVRADVVRRLMPFPADLPYDWWIGVGVAALGEVQYVDEFLVHYRIHDHNAYHPAGSRLRRLRSEQGFRVGIMEALLKLGSLSSSQQIFVEDFLLLLRRSHNGWFSLKLLRFYFKNAAIFFGGTRSQISPFTGMRKSIGATAGALLMVAHKDRATVSVGRPLVPSVVEHKQLRKAG